jgi:uncharacterized protein involved in outer membrane biogenesis
MRTLLILLLSAIALAIAGLVALPWLTPQNFARERLATAIERKGHFQLETVRNIRMQAFPQPGFEAEGLVLQYTGTKAMTGAPDISVEHVFFAVDPMSLFSRRPRVSAVKADQARVHLGGKAKETLDSDDRLTLDRIDLAIEQSASGAPAKLAGVIKSRALAEDIQVTATLGAAGEGNHQDSAPLYVEAVSGNFRWTIDGELARQRPTRFLGKLRLDIPSVGNIEILRNLSLQGRLAVVPEYVAFSDASFETSGMKGRLQIYGDAKMTTISLQDLLLLGGRGQGKIELYSRSAGGGLSADFNVSDVDALAFSQSVSNFDWVSGKTSLSLKAESSGNDIAHILDRLKGTGRVDVHNGAIEGLDLPGIVADVRDGELRGWRRKQGRRTAFDSFSLPFRIDGGVATISELQLNGPNIAATGEGTANLASQKLDLRLKAQVDARDGSNVTADGSDNAHAERNDNAAPNENDSAASSDAPPAETASLTVPLRIKGHWNQLQVQPDVSEALKDRKSLKKSIKLFGKSIEKLTGGKVKSQDLGNLLDGLLGKDKKKRREDERNTEPSN